MNTTTTQEQPSVVMPPWLQDAYRGPAGWPTHKHRARKRRRNRARRRRTPGPITP